KGAVIWADRLMMLFARDVLSRNPGAEIVFDVKCSGNLPRDISAHGGRPQMWRTGHSLIKKRMQESGALLAGEMSGHIFFKERWYGFDDGLYSAARLLEILAKDARAADVIFDALPDALNTPELRVDMEEGEHYAYMERLMQRVDHFPGARPTTIDGLRVDYADGWGLVRASNTTPCLVLRFEGNDQAALARIQEQFRSLMLALEPGLKLPF
ncbi:MAG TPA: phosphomannomutase/phosphoglucomutase, partial [Gammaproteobacteria bacterium]